MIDTCTTYWLFKFPLVKPIHLKALYKSRSLPTLPSLFPKFPTPMTSYPDEFPATGSPPDAINQFMPTGTDLRLPLQNLSTLRDRMDSVQRFLSDKVNSNTIISQHQMSLVSDEIAAAIHQVIVNGAALLSSSNQVQPPPTDLLNRVQNPNPNPTVIDIDLKSEEIEEEGGDKWDIIELDAVELLAEHVHFCEICGKGFKRDANLRMHMRAHGNKFKTVEALLKPEKPVTESTTHRLTRFSCPYSGCNRNKNHRKFRPLKSVICVKNHFKRSHCPKMFSCNRCNKKNFSVVADLKSHMKHCGESKWKCSCGTSFSRKDKLFGHMTLFEGHMPAVAEDVEVEDANENDVKGVEGIEFGGNGDGDYGFFDGLLDGFGSIDDFCLQDVLGGAANDGSCSSVGGGSGLDWVL